MSQPSNPGPAKPLSRLVANLSVRTKLLVTLGAGVLAAVAVAATAIQGLGNVSERADNIYNLNLRQAELVASIDGTLTRVDVNILRMLAIGTPETIAGWKAENQKRFVAVDATLNELQALVKDPTQSALIAELKKSYAAMRSGMEKQVVEIEAGRKARAGEVNAELVKPNADATFGNLTKLSELNATTAAAEYKAGQDAQRSARLSIVLSLAIGAALALLIGMAIASTIVNGLRSVRASLAAMAKGDLMQRTDVHGRDEVGQMALAVGDAQNGVREVVSLVATSARSLADAAARMAATSDQISASASQTSQQAEIVSAAADRVSANVQTVSSGSEEMGASITEISQNANEAAQVASDAVGVAAQTNKTVTKLGESSTEIASVVKTITSIAEQTNLLALNATIEAARAGDAGKGFAVVANEVKELAQETAGATEDISRRVATIQSDIEEAVASIARISETISRINDFQITIASAVEEQTATTGEMNRNVAEAAGSSSEIARTITGVAAAARETSAGIGHSQAAVADLTQMSSDLLELVARFRH